MDLFPDWNEIHMLVKVFHGILLLLFCVVFLMCFRSMSNHNFHLLNVIIIIIAYFSFVVILLIHSLYIVDWLNLWHRLRSPKQVINKVYRHIDYQRQSNDQ